MRLLISPAPRARRLCAAISERRRRSWRRRLLGTRRKPPAAAAPVLARPETRAADGFAARLDQSGWRSSSASSQSKRRPSAISISIEDLNVQVFAPYPGRIIQAFRRSRRRVKQGQILFTIESPDFIAAESNSDLGGRDTRSDRERADTCQGSCTRSKASTRTTMRPRLPISRAPREHLRAARNAVAIFGKTEAEIDQHRRRRARSRRPSS